ncbi:MAG: hypothetical protein OHK0040_02770 [bacterium]
MHEASLALSVIEQMEQYENNNNVVIEKVVLEVGRGSGVNLYALSFCLDELKKQLKKDVEFEFKEKPIRAECSSCGAKLELEYPTYLCPACKDASINITEGLEFNITEFEVSDR